jgi:anti-anti-sigma factor
MEPILNVRFLSGSRLILSGDLDLSSASSLLDVLGPFNGHEVVLDLRDLAFIDACGMRALEQARVEHPGLRIENASDRHRRLFQLGGLLDVLVPEDRVTIDLASSGVGLPDYN